MRVGWVSRPVRCRRVLLALTAGVALAGSIGLLGPGLAGAAVADKQVDADVFAPRFCAAFFEFQVAALESNDDIAGARATPAAAGALAAAERTQIIAELKTSATDAHAVATAVARAGTPKVKNGSDIASRIIDLSDQASTELGSLAKTSRALPTADASRFGAKLRKVDTAFTHDLQILGKGYDGIRRLDPKRVFRQALAEEGSCSTLGGRWAALPTSASSTSTAATSTTSMAAAGSVATSTTAAPSGAAGTRTGDAAAPQILLPAGRAPSAAIAALATRAAMGPRAWLIFYGATPVVDAGASFSSHCPKPEAPDAFVLGCYNFDSGKIYVLAVNRAEVAGLTDVSAAHETLHAAYARLTTAQRANVDAMTAAFFATTTDEHLRQQVSEYDQSEPGERANELHSLIATEIVQLPSELETYYSRYFRDRQAVVASYQTAAGVFANLKRQHDALIGQLDALKAQLDGLEAQINNAESRAQSLAAQIDSLRAQGRIAESNNLVGPQNGAVEEAQGLVNQYNQLVDQYNGLVDQANAVATTDRDLLSSLRPAS